MLIQHDSFSSAALSFSDTSGPDFANQPASDVAPDPTASLLQDALQQERSLRLYLRHRFPTIDADDVLQESYLKLLRTKRRSAAANTKAYFFCVARNTALTLFQRNRRRSEISLDELPSWQTLDSGSDAAETADASYQADRVLQAIDLLPARCRQIIVLAFVKGLTPSEVALHLGLSHSTVRVQLCRATQKLAVALRESALAN